MRAAGKVINANTLKIPMRMKVIFYEIIKYNIQKRSTQSLRKQKTSKMQKQQLPPVLLSHRRNYTNTSIPQGKISQHTLSEVPIVTRRGSKANNLSMRDIMTDQSYIDKQLKSLSQGRESQMRMSIQKKNKEKQNLKFLRYKFNPNGDNGQEDNIWGEKGNEDVYGQLGGGTKEKISMNVFYERKNVLFQDYRAPLVYKKLFIQRQQNV